MERSSVVYSNCFSTCWRMRLETSRFTARGMDADSMGLKSMKLVNEKNKGAHSEPLGKLPQGVSQMKVGPCFVQVLRGV